MIMHFYTTSKSEPTAGYQSEGISCYVYIEKKSNSTPLYRWRQTESNLHFYTTDANGEAAPQLGYVSEGIQCYVFPEKQPGTVAFYRWYQAESGNHLYTLDVNGELAPSSGYVFEGVACYVYPSQEPETVPLYRWVSGKQAWCVTLFQNSATEVGRYTIYAESIDEANNRAKRVLRDHNITYENTPKLANYFQLNGGAC